MRRTFRQAQHVWDEVEAEMALHLDAIHADISTPRMWRTTL